MSGWTVAWIVWLLAFAVIEGLALANKTEGDTLSEHVWRWLLPNRGHRLWRLRRLTLITLMGWLALHFLTGGAF